MTDKGVVKTGADHLAALRDGREVLSTASGSTTSPPTRRSATRSHSAAALYDYQALPENLERMTFPAPPPAAMPGSTGAGSCRAAMPS